VCQLHDKLHHTGDRDSRSPARASEGDREEAASARYGDIVGVSDEAIVSTDIIHDPRASIIDCTLTPVVDSDLVK
jgi:glyceraldehyde-3-phosphate dehydrogenase/erythrose-4-phosphate dehydrogenase